MNKNILKILSHQRDVIDGNLLNIKNYLESTGFGYKRPLIDSEGFPFPEIDHQKILIERKKASRLLNDRKRIEYLLEEFISNNNDSLKLFLEKEKPFAIILDIKENSPAEKSGLIEGDFLIKFGNSNSFFDIKNNIIENQEIDLIILRIEKFTINKLNLKIIPMKWEGDGFVGCFLSPF